MLPLGAPTPQVSLADVGSRECCVVTPPRHATFAKPTASKRVTLAVEPWDLAADRRAF